VYHLTAEGMHFTVTETLRATRVEKWICAVKQQFLDAVPIKCVALDSEFTNPHEGRHNQRAAILQLSVASEVLVFQICRANGVPQLLKEFLKDTTIKFCGAAIDNDVRMLRYYVIEIPSVYELQKIIPYPTKNQILSLYDLSNATIGTNLKKKKRNKKDKKKDKKKDEKKDDKEEEELIFGWGNIPLSFEQVMYAALDARLGFEIARRHWKLHGYNSHVDRLNIMVDE
jgi:ribonuclease D